MDATHTNSQRNKEIVERFLAIFSGGDVPRILECMTADGTWWVSGSLAGISGTYRKPEFATLLRQAKAAYKGGALRITPLRMVAEGDFVAVEASSHAELLNGRIYANRYHFLFEVRADKISSVREYMDTQHAHDTFVVG
jgi:uncharacterized protein